MVLIRLFEDAALTGVEEIVSAACTLADTTIIA
jgi:hypothetical protein